MIRRCILTVALLAAGLAAAGCDANKADPTGPQDKRDPSKKQSGLPPPPPIEPAGG